MDIKKQKANETFDAPNRIEQKDFNAPNISIGSHQVARASKFGP